MFRLGLLGFGLLGLGFLGLILHLLIWVLLIVIVVKIIRGHRNGHHLLAKRNDNALEILRTRYAKGEIDTDEYNKRKQDLLS
jgi:putative membrane protein